jgi:hypothetical protein
MKPRTLALSAYVALCGITFALRGVAQPYVETLLGVGKAADVFRFVSSHSNHAGIARCLDAKKKLHRAEYVLAVICLVVCIDPHSIRDVGDCDNASGKSRRRAGFRPWVGSLWRHTAGVTFYVFFGSSG